MTTQDQFEERAQKLLAAIPAIGNHLGLRLTETVVHIFSTALRAQDRASRNTALEEAVDVALSTALHFERGSVASQIAAAIRALKVTT